ncbi:MAG: UDP-N-acetylmuramoyl-L-alanine--D-glutamate ligase, partial [Planctomycetes bacterium]|nr:UDP-N-acetylmuramoyl-L-alanine--D-glutamate ligase [Planctomycetota bacterium]
MLKHGAKVFLSDKRVNDEIKKECERLQTKGLTYELGVHSKKNIVNQDLLVVSPGVNLENQVVIEAEKKGVPVVGE